ncbi:MAG: hypothetical protein ACTHLW_00815, partial [Verrucomicrobiota bacterium]
MFSRTLCGLFGVLLLGVLLFSVSLQTVEPSAMNFERFGRDEVSSRDNFGLEKRSFEDAHESDGPEGAQEIPTKRMPIMGIGFAVFTLFGSGLLVWRAGKTNLDK